MSRLFRTLNLGGQPVIQLLHAPQSSAPELALLQGTVVVERSGEV